MAPSLALILRQAWARLPIHRDLTGPPAPARTGGPRAIPELVEAARARLDPILWDYASGGAESEVTLRRNRTAVGRFALRSRALPGATWAKTATSFLGHSLALPVMLAPVGPLDFFHPDGALASARAAHRAGTAAFVGMLSFPSLQEVRQGSRGPLFFQLYAWGDRDWLGGLVRRVEAAGYHGLCLTVDTAALGRRERDLHNRYAPAGRHPNLMGLPAEPSIARQFQASLTWDDLGWLRGLTRLPIMLKGVLCAEDAALAVEQGVDVVYVSNHGGRQLDHAQATIEVLPEITRAVGGKAEVLVDGGFLRGSEVVTALALGARAVLIGKLQVWGLAAGGEEGLVRTLELLREEIAATMATVGAGAVPDLGPHVVVPAPPRSPGGGQASRSLPG